MKTSLQQMIDDKEKELQTLRNMLEILEAMSSE